MPVNRRQHLVSQFMIRQFLGDRDRLYCLDKTTLAVLNRSCGNLPADILKKSYYYTTDTDDFDGEIVRPLEDKFAPICRGLVEEHEVTASTSGVWTSLVDWCALSLTRSLLVGHVTPIACDTLSEEEKADLPADRKAMTLVVRRALFQRIRAEMSRSEVMFRFLKSPRDFGFYLTDYPPVAIPFPHQGGIGPMLLPLTHDLMLIEAPREVANGFFDTIGQPEMGWLALMQCGWAKRFVYSVDLESLDFAVAVLSQVLPGQAPEMSRRARLPFFGFGQTSELASIWSTQDLMPPSH